MKAAVVTFPGSNCDDDAFHTLHRTMEWQVDKLWHKDTPDLGEYRLIVLPGGFSYGDYLRCGAVASLSPIMTKVKEYAERGGLVLGICNGFQILCEAGLVPGALARNESVKFICRDVALKVESSDSPWTNQLREGDEVTFPIAHAEGRYLISEEEYAGMKARGQILLTYLDNPNGSLHSVAGVCNEKKNVFGLMPHPERASDLRSRNGLALWKSIAHWAEKTPQ